MQPRRKCLEKGSQKLKFFRVVRELAKHKFFYHSTYMHYYLYKHLCAERNSWLHGFGKTYLGLA